MSVTYEARQKLWFYVGMLIVNVITVTILGFTMGWSGGLLVLGIFMILWWAFWIVAHMYNRHLGRYDKQDPTRS